MQSILIVEDELIAAAYLEEILKKNGFDVLGIIDNGQEALEKIPSLKPDLVLMDIMLQGNISGSEVALELKHLSPTTPIVFLTAYANDEMLEYAVESNSYGYLMKPYNEVELINTLKVILARLEKDLSQDKKPYKQLLKLSEDLVFDTHDKKLFRDGTEVSLSSNALKLLDLLCKHPNSIVSNEQISFHLWNEQRSAVTLRTQIYRIRSQIGKDIIHNINGRGYMIKTPRDET